jgi:hypothetical protein
MLAELKQVHEELLTALDDLDAITNAPRPDETRLASARVRLSRASNKRRRIVEAATLNLLDTATPVQARELRALRERYAAQLESSTRHISSWGLRDIMADWPGYCRAATAMRQSLRDLVADDRATLYPLLVRTP